MSTKQKGDIAEQAVILEALKRGWDVLTPVGDRLPYDLALGKDEVFVKVQVKSAWREKDSGNYVTDVRRTKTNRRKMVRARYSVRDFDFAIVYISDIDVFYVFPVEVFVGYGSEIHMVEDSKRQRKPQSAKYRDAWHLIS